MSPRPASNDVIPGVAALSVGHPHTTPPDGWEWVRLTEIARLESGHTPSRKHPEYWNGDVPWVSLPDARRHHGGVIHDTTQKTNGEGLANSAARLLPTDTVCLSRTASVGYVFRLGRPMATSQDFVNWVCSDAVDPRFLMYALMAEGDHILNFGKGTTHTTIYFPEVLAFYLCLPPLAEQRRIVDKIEIVLARVHAALEQLARLPAILKGFRHSVLATACSGRLTQDIRGRSEHDDGDIPRGWTLARATDACSLVQSGGTPRNKPFTAAGDIPFLKIFNIVNQKVTFEARTQFIPLEIHRGELRRSVVRPGDVLMNIVGPPLGKVAIVPDTFPEWNINQALVAFRPKPGLDPEFLYYLLCEGSEIRRIENEYRGSAGQVNISLSQARDFMFPLPPLSEQKEIVRHVQTFFGLADSCKRRLALASTRIEKVTQAVLAKAFRGELVATEAELARSEGRSYEPATALLERIRTPRTTTTQPQDRPAIRRPRRKSATRKTRVSA